MDFHLGVSKIIEQIIQCNLKKIDLYTFLENTWGIYQLIKDQSTIDFQNEFHNNWDHIDELIALSINDKSIFTEILPAFKQSMIKYL